MKILVVSDNHGDRDCLVDLVNHYEGQVDAPVSYTHLDVYKRQSQS